MSQTAVPLPSPSCGRAVPRWSVGGHPTESPASMAGLPASRACVEGGPPLCCSGPSLGSTPLRSPEATKPQLPSLSRLCPWELIAPLQSPPVGAVLCATIVFFSVTVVTVPSLRRPPPTELTVLPLTVLF